MGEQKKSKVIKRNLTIHDMDLSECGKYQELNGSWVIWMLLSGIILCFKNLYSGIVLIAISVIIFLIYKRNPRNISATYYNLALDCITKEEMDKAKEALMEAIKYNKENKIAFILLSSIYYKEENYLETINNIINSKVLEVENSKYNYLVGACYFNVEDYENSIKYLSAVKYEKTNPMKYIRDILLAKAYCLNKDYDNSFKIFNRLVDISDEFKGNVIEYSYFSGLTYLRVGEKEKAAKELKKVYEADRNYMEIENLITEID
jgi:tetratricopeptide (TPR) repeat protein